MDTNNEEQIQDQTSSTEVDPWIAAFAALDKKDESNSQENGERDSSSEIRSGNINEANEGNVSLGSSAGADGNQNSGTDETSNGINNDGSTGEPSIDSGENAQQSTGAEEDLLGVSEQDIKSYEDELLESVRDRAVNEMAKEFVKRGIRNTNGRLGATIDDSDICKRDKDGIPHFYNPDTGKEFTGDNPRRQAQEWCEDYNKDLASSFNTACERYVDKLMEQEKPRIETLKFAPIYDKLDPIRQTMFDSIVEDYEITDSDGDVIGYSCDLNKALAAVNRQVGKIQEYSKLHYSTPSSTPALDMKASGSGTAVNTDRKPTSLADALLIQQEKILNERKK